MPDMSKRDPSAPRQSHSIVRRTQIPRSTSQPLVTPLSPTAVWSAADADALDAMYEGRADGYSYAREGHPNWDVVAEKVAYLEGVTGGIVTGSGMSAIAAALLGALKAGDHVLAGDQLYGRSLRFLSEDLPRLGFATDFADATDAKMFLAAVRPETRVILLEAVSNPTLRVADLEPILAAAKARGILTLIDNTFTTPRALQPFAMGADIVVHSVTKLLAGHSDVTLGWVRAADDALMDAIRGISVTMGLTPSPFDCWLAERGLHSFELRYDRAAETAAALADALGEISGVDVLYPGRADHPDHAAATALLGGRFGNMVSFRIAGGREAANRLIRALPDVPFAPTLGDIGTTLSHAASSSHRGLTPDAREALGITEGFFRVSVGIEDAELLIGEFREAVAAALVPNG